MQKKRLAITVSTFLSLWPLSNSSEAHSSRYPTTAADLVLDILIANHNHVDDVIDLGGRTFYIQVGNNTSANGANCLPIIQPDLAITTPHRLTIKNGALEISLLSNQNCRHFEVAIGATLVLENVRLKYGNSDSDGGSIYNSGTVTTHHVAFIANNAVGNGGSIYNNGGLSIGSTTFNHNSAGGDGGAVYNIGHVSNLINSTFANNVGINGGAIATTNGVIASMTNNTIALNDACAGGGIYNENPFGTLPANIIIFIANIVSGNTAFAGTDILDSAPGINNPQYNLVGLAGPSWNNSIDATGSHNLFGTTSSLDPQLGPLQDNGGPVWTMALLDTSPAINTGYNPFALRWDERGHGYRRTSGRATDIGAYEFQVHELDSDGDGVCNENDSCPCRFTPAGADCHHDNVGGLGGPASPPHNKLL